MGMGTTVQLVSRNRIVTGIWTVLPNVVWHFTNLFSKITENIRRVEREIGKYQMKKNDIRHSVLFVMFMYSFICIFHLTYLRILLLSACSNLFVSALAYKNIFFLSLLLLFVFALSLQEVISLLSALSLCVSLVCLFLTIHACYTPTQANL